MQHWQIMLRPTVPSDLASLFLFQLDEAAGYMAAFTAKDPYNKAAYLEKFTRHLADPAINMQTILANDVIAGSIAKFEIAGAAEITYWIGREYWGKGIATTALKEFLSLERVRPLGGRAAADNFGSRRMLEKCGFIRTGSDRGFANARQAEIDEVIYTLE